MKFLLIDLFCGAGGTTTGVEKAKHFGRKVSKVIACVNHDPVAIASHASNHKSVKHFTEDIRTLDLVPIIVRVKKYRQQHPNWPVCIWASLECTNFSNAKGGQPRDADSRTLAEHLYRYIDEIGADYVFIENVVEFMSWGPLKNGKPISRDKGKDYMKWVQNIKNRGFDYDYRVLNSADFGAFTSRKRYFGVFAKGFPIAFPQATHAKNPKAQGLFEKPLKKWKAVKEVLDLQDEGKSIFERNKELSEKTLARIYAGLLKYVAGGKDVFIQKYYSGRPKGKVTDANSPLGTITTAGTQAVVKCNFIAKYFTGNPDDQVKSVESPVGAITTIDHHSLITGNFLMKYYGNGENVMGVDEVCGTITTKDRVAKVHINQFLDKQFSGPQNHQPVETPAGALTTTPKLNLVTTKPFIMSTHFNNVGSDVNDPHGVITANRKHSYLINPSWFGNNGDTNKPCPTIVARQDKAPLYCVVVNEYKEATLAIPVFETDSEIMIKIKEFMVLYSIVDIKMRMLKVLELLKIQGFPADYILKGNQSQQKKFIGNSVVPEMSKQLIKSNYIKLLELIEERKAA